MISLPDKLRKITEEAYEKLPEPLVPRIDGVHPKASSEPSPDSSDDAKFKAPPGIHPKHHESFDRKLSRFGLLKDPLPVFESG